MREKVAPGLAFGASVWFAAKVAFLALVAALALKPVPSHAAAIRWSNWDARLFATAKAERRFVILDLEAVWCHWCHVMTDTTYADAKVQALIAQHFMPVRVDQDAHPDLSSRYGDWGWPATIIFGPDGAEIAKIRGYVEPARMTALLQAVIDDPSPGPSAEADEPVTPAAAALLPKGRRDALRQAFDQSFDEEHGGWGNGPLRFIDGDSINYALALAEEGNAKAARDVRRTLDAAHALIDPVWGGVYQYSDKTDWSSPHFEKIMSFQAQYLRDYSAAFNRWHSPRDREAMDAIFRYLTSTLLGANGAFYVSQDADLDEKTNGHVFYALDDGDRRKLGRPKVDVHQYARENGWAISGIVSYYNATNDAQALKTAVAAARWVEANRAIAGGGFRHDAQDRGGPFLGDTLAMAQAFVDLYAATGDRHWLAAADSAAQFIATNFYDGEGGFRSTKQAEAGVGVFTKPHKQVEDQLAVVRTMAIIANYTGKSVYRDAAQHAMQFAIGATNGFDGPLPGLLLADLRLAHAPTHVTIIGHKDDETAQRLDAAARALPTTHLRLDWWDTREGPLANKDIEYPDLGQSAAFACGERTCSLPAFSAGELVAAIERMSATRNRGPRL